MTDPTDNLDPPAAFHQPTWKPRHRVDPMRPANPRADEIVHHYLQEHPDPPTRTDTDRKGPNLFLGLILFVVGVIGICIVAALFAGFTWLMLFLTKNIS